MRLVALTCCLLLSGCVVELWRSYFADPSLAPIGARERAETIDFDLVAARGRFDATPSRTHIQLLLSSPTSDPEIGHAAGWTEEEPGCVSIRPSPFETEWLFAADPAFVPETWEAKVFGGQHTSLHGFTARVNLEGDIDARVLGTLLEEAPETEREFRPRPFAERWETDALTSLEQHDWSALLGGEPTISATPLAWTDSGGQTFATAPDLAEPEELALVVAFDTASGDRTFAKIPASILAGAYDQELERVGDRIRWRYSDVWRARHTRPLGAGPLAIAQGPNVIPYEWSYPIPEPLPGWLDSLGFRERAFLTPFALAIDVLDFVTELNPALKRLKEFLFDIERPDLDPIRQRKD